MNAHPGRPLPPSAFEADDGSADPRVVAALAAFERGDGGAVDVLTALAGGRLLVPVVAVVDSGAPEAEGHGGVAAEKSSHMATVTTTGRDGRTGMLAFTCTASMRRWDPEARPAPVPTRSAAEAALADGADALVVDLAGPVVFSVDAADLRSLASGWRPLGPWPGVADVEVTPPVSEPAAAPDRTVVARLRGMLRRGRSGSQA